MNRGFQLLLKENLKSWFRAKGFWMIVVAALVPPLLTGAWVFTHQDDVQPVEIIYEPTAPRDGDLVNITAEIANQEDRRVGPFNVTMQVGFFEQVTDDTEPVFRERASQEFRLDGMGPRETTTVEMNWTAQAGTFVFRVLVDTDNEVAEYEDNNNDRHVQVQVAFPSIRPDFDPGIGGEQNASLPDADLNVVSLVWDRDAWFVQQEGNVTVTVANAGPDDVENATVELDVRRVQPGGFTSRVRLFSEPVSIAAGGENTATFAWTPGRNPAQYAFFASIDPAGAANDNATQDNLLIEQAFIDRQFLYEPPEPKQTAKDFYRDILAVLHLKLLIPLIALFYAGGVIEDEKERGNLPYLLTRPLPRWTMPVTRFVVSVLVAGAAIIIGLLVTYFLLLGLPQEAPGFFYYPLVFSLLALVVYSGVFVLLGVASSRPYLIGLLYALGFEAVVILGRNIVVNGRPLLQDWVLNFSLNHWMTEAFDGWDTTQPFQWLPQGAEALRAMWVVLAIGAAGLLGSIAWMRRREFEV